MFPLSSGSRCWRLSLGTPLRGWDGATRRGEIERLVGFYGNEARLELAENVPHGVLATISFR